MTDLFATVAGIAVIAAAVVISSISLLLLRKLQRGGGSMMEGMAQVVFLPEKRKRYLWLMSVEGSLFTLSAIGWGLFELGLVPREAGTVAFASTFLGGLVFLTWRSILGLRPAVLTDADRALIREGGPAMLRSLAFIPLDESEEAKEARQRLYVLALPQDDFGALPPAQAAGGRGRRSARSRASEPVSRERPEP